MKSILKNLSHKIFIADLSNKRHIEDIVMVLDAYKCDGMGQSPPYTDIERENLKHSLASHPTVKVFLLYIEDIAAGGAVCFSSFSTFTTKPVLNIHDICVIKTFRGKGYGRELMKSIVIGAMEMKCSKLTLEVREDNTIAKKLYGSLGFTESTPVMNFWHKPL